jgi:hypothetical protein
MIDFDSQTWLCLALLLVPVAIKLLGNFIYTYLLRTTTVLPYLEDLGRPRRDARFPGTALVAGGRYVWSKQVVRHALIRDASQHVWAAHCTSTE